MATKIRNQMCPTKSVSSFLVTSTLHAASIIEYKITGINGIHTTWEFYFSLYQNTIIE